MRTAIIGAGRMGRVHLSVAAALGLDVVGVCDTQEAVVKSAVAESGLSPETIFVSASDMLESTRPECVVISTTAPSHETLTSLAASHGATHILCEKPMATSLDECDTMIHACESHGVRLAINHHARFNPLFTRPKEIASSDAFGGITSVTLVAGNIGLAMNGTHRFEMFRFLTNETPKEVTAWLTPEESTNPRGPEFHDCGGTVRATTASGKRLYLEIGTDQGHGITSVYAGPGGQITVDELTGELRCSVRESEYRSYPTYRYSLPATVFTEHLPQADAAAPTKAALSALLAGEDYPTGDDGRSAIAALVAAYHSDEHGHVPFRLDHHLDASRRFPWP